MNKEYFILNNNIIGFNIEVNFNNLMSIINFYMEITKDFTDIVIDFKNIINPNSCILVFMISCVRNSRKRRQNIKFINISKVILELSRLYNIDTIIPI